MRWYCQLSDGVYVLKVFSTNSVFMGDNHAYNENKYFDHSLSNFLLKVRDWSHVTQLAFYATDLEDKRMILLIFIEELGSEPGD